jgi:hypothetical protein
MHPLGQVIFGCITVFAVWTMIRALRTGSIFSKGMEFNVNGQPIAFSLVFAGHLILVGLCVWMAAGREPADFFHMLAFRMR